MHTGKVWKYGDNINTDIISPPASLEYSIEDAKSFTMSAVDSDFGKLCQPGDIFVAEHNLGSGSSRENAPLMLKALGIRYVIAMDYARIFYRNCINIGLLPIECAETKRIEKDDILEVDHRAGIIKNITKQEDYVCSKIPAHIAEIADCGGLIGYIKAKKL